MVVELPLRDFRDFKVAGRFLILRGWLRLSTVSRVSVVPDVDHTTGERGWGSPTRSHVKTVSDESQSESEVPRPVSGGVLVGLKVRSRIKVLGGRLVGRRLRPQGYWRSPSQ